MAPNQEPAGLRKVQPKLRMVANGGTDVTIRRAEHCAALAVPAALVGRVLPDRTEGSAPVRAAPRARKRSRLTKPPPAFVSVFVQLTAEVNRQLREAAPAPLTAVKADVATAVLTVEQALELGRSSQVSFVELGQPLVPPRPRVSPARVARPPLELRRFGDARRHRNGADVLIGIVDVGGFDFAHPDFLERGKTRFLSIWDQGGNTRPSPAERGTAAFDYGAELVADDLNRAIAAAAEQNLPAYVLEPQSQMSEGSHGTHVASIAAGGRGICRRARIAAVLVSIPEDDLERRGSLYDSTQLAHAVDYLLAIADRERLPISINVSLGTNGHAHDDSSLLNRWIDASLARPGRSVCVAAGNAGQESPEDENDIGFILGRIHASGQIRARELTTELEWNVVGNGIADLSENELEIWYGPQDRFSVQLKPPGAAWSEVVSPGEFIENRQIADRCFFSVYNELYYPANGANLIAVYLSPNLDQTPVVGVTAGQWLVRLIGHDVRDGRFHCWIERDDPRPVGREGGRDTWIFPSFFSERSFVDSSTISSLACGPRVVAVANLDEGRRRINITSSQGPTREGREKPDIAAPGTDVVAARGFSPDDPWVAMSGTSMASPYVAGVVGLMLAVNKSLTAAQIGGILRRTANPLPGTDFDWRNDAGAGQIDPRRCLTEAEAIGTPAELR